MKKLSVLLLVLTALSVSASAAEWSLPETSVTYGGEVVIDETSSTPDITCDPDAGAGSYQCPKKADLTVLGCQDVSATLTKSGDHYKTSFNVPEFAACGIGDHNLEVTGETTSSRGGNLRVNPEGQIGGAKPPGIAKYLYIRGDMSSGANKIHSFLLSNQQWDNPRKPGDGDIAIDEVDSLGNPNEKCIVGYEGGIINKSSIAGSLDYAPKLKYDTNEQCKETNGPLGLLSNDFSTYKMKIKDPDVGGSFSKFWKWNLGGWSPVHGSTSYRPQGEILLGYHHPDESSTAYSKDTRLFFVCRESTDGQVASMHGTTDSIWRCDATSSTEKWRDSEKNDWEKVTECSDGVDNDGDGKIDEPSDCDTYKDETEGPDNCGPVVMKTADGFAAKWDGQLQSGSCSYSSSQSLSDYSNSGAEPDRFSCSSVTSGSFSDSGRNSLCDKADYSGHGGVMPAVEYYPTANYLGSEGEEVLDKSSVEEGDVWSSKFVSSDGGFQSKYQTLHQAEKKYDNGTSDSSCEWCHNADTWLDKGVQNAADYSQGSYMDSWNVSRPGEFDDHPEAGSNFAGGFIPYCQDSLVWSWNVNGDWVCSVGSSQASMTVEFNETQGNLTGRTVGFKISEADASAFEVAYGNRGGIAETDDYYQFQVQAQCFLGKNGVNRPDQSGEYVNMTRNVQTSGPTYVVAELPNRDFSTAEDQSLVSRTDYTCVFGFVKNRKAGTIDPSYPETLEAITEGRSGLHNIDVNADVTSLSGANIGQWKSATTTGTDIWTLFNTDRSEQQEFNHPGLYYDSTN